MTRLIPAAVNAALLLAACAPAAPVGEAARADHVTMLVPGTADFAAIGPVLLDITRGR
ncbi:hypothetical protein ACLBKU_10280 [Erythrobacter sp. NE805]|uniref:hypothetical protein n=1 Tax=Erythrobacter sp. NE805 TaxID=3389875 RepID=UPI00396B3790